MADLTGIFTDIAAAIREKRGTTAKMTPAAMPAEIKLIDTESGSSSDSGGTASAAETERDVRFRDYDGTVVKSYSFEEALSLTALPGNPSHDGLLFQEWNRTLTEVKTLAGYGLRTDVYAIYVPSDGKTRIRLWVMLEKFKEMWLFACSKDGVLTVDWGDGTTDQMDWTGFDASTSGSVNRYLHHAYAAIGEYTVTISGTAQVSLNADLTEVYGNYSACYGDMSCSPQSLLMINASTSESKSMQDAGDAIREVVIGKNVRVCGKAFEGAKLKSLIIPNGTAFVNTSGAFCTSRGFPDIGLPSDLKTLNGEFRTGGIKRIVLPDGITSLYEAFDVSKTEEVIIPASATTLTYAFRYSGETCGNGNLAPNCRFIFLGSSATVGSYSFPSGCPIYVTDENYDTLSADEKWKTNYFDKGVVHKISELTSSSGG